MLDEFKYVEFNKEKVGTEIEYEIVNNEIHLFLSATNSSLDWVTDFLPWPRKKYRGKKFHQYWLKDAIQVLDWLYLMIEELSLNIDTVKIMGWSRGGVVGEYLSILIENDFKTYVLSVGGPKSGLKNHTALKATRLKQKSDIVPLYPILYKNFTKIEIEGKRDWFWKAHSNYNIRETAKEFFS